MSKFTVVYYNRVTHERGMIPDDEFKIVLEEDKLYRAYLKEKLVRCERLKYILGPFADADEAFTSGILLICPCKQIKRNRWNYGGTVVESIIRPDCPYCHGNARVKWIDEESQGPEGERINDHIDVKPYANRHALLKIEKIYADAAMNLEGNKKRLRKD
jgi:hypothetical protein